MKDKMKIHFGKLGSIEVITLIDQHFDIMAKWTSSAGTRTCSDGTVVSTGGPDYADDAGSCLVTAME